MESAMPQVITQLKIVSWLYIFCSIATFFLLVISFMQGRLYFYFNNANCAMKCFTNPLNQSIPNVVELHNDYKTCHEGYIILQDENESKDKQFSDTEKEKNDLIKTSDKPRKDWIICEKKLDAYKKYLEFIGSINRRIEIMGECMADLQMYCTYSKNGDYYNARNMIHNLTCEGDLSQDYYDKIKAPYGKMLKYVLMVKKNFTDLLITGNFEMMQEIYELRKDLPTDKCHFICILGVENLDTQFSSSYWRSFEDGWKFCSKYF